MPRAPKRFLRKTIETFLVVGVVVTLIAPAAVFWTSWSQNQRYLEASANEIAEIVGGDARYSLLAASKKDAQRLLSNAVKIPDVIRIVLYQKEGRVLAASESPHLLGSKRVYSVSREIHAKESSAPSGVEDAGVQSQSIGAIRLELSLDRGYAASMNTARQVGIVLILLSVVLALAVIRLSAQILGPLSTLARLVTHAEGLSEPTPKPKQSNPWEVHSIYAAVRQMQERVFEGQETLRAYAESLEQQVQSRTADLEQARDEAERANRAKTFFLANVSHELRTPLQAIITFAKMDAAAVRKSGLNPLQSIVTASTHLLDLIEQLLVLSRAEAGNEIRLSREVVNVTDLVRETADTLRATLSARNTLIVERPTADIVVYSDRTRIRQLIVNLARNADKFTDGGRIVVSLTQADPGTTCISVSDDGIGIDQRDLDRIFDPFYQGQEHKAGMVSSGIGLGLWLSRRIAEALGGNLQVASAPGRGSEFTFRVPTGMQSIPQETPAGRESERDPSAAYAAVSGARLLLADDEAIIRRPLAAILRRRGAIVEEVGDGRAALEAIERCTKPYDALILDYRMPYVHGVEILERLRAALHNVTPVIIFTADENPALLDKVERLQGSLLVKPVLPDTLLESLESLLILSQEGTPKEPAP